MRRSPLTFLLLDCSLLSWTRVAASCLLLLACSLPFTTAIAQSGTANRFAADSSTPAEPSTVVSDPYLVFVAEEAAHLRCGPSGDEYRTDPLRHGQELEVYVETGDGWLGVRPTEDSFCWIPADATRLLPADKTADAKTDAIEAEIVEDKTVAWIGTNLGRARRYRWQVQLGEGETVTILGRSERDGPDGPQTWYRIVPPSGEFRWIHRDQVVTTAEELLADLKTNPDAAAIEFLSGGPSRPTSPISQTANTRNASTDKPDTGLRRVSDDQPYRENAPAESRQNRAKALAEIRRLDEIERNIESRSRMLAERSGDLAAGESVLLDKPEPGSPEEFQSQHANPDHQMRSFSQRVTEGLSTLIGGRRPPASELEPLTESSRRVPELVPIGSGLAASASPSPQSVASTDTISAPAAIAAPAQSSRTLPTPTMPAPVAPPIAKTVPATDTPGFRSGESQIAITSAPRLVNQSPPSGFAASGFTPADNAFPPAKMRTITSEQMVQVQRSVAESTADSLPLVMSSLMARGASAPEIRLVADAAQAFSLNELAQRARQYEALARRRDGDTVVATSTLLSPIAVAASNVSAPNTPFPNAPSPNNSPPPGNTFLPRETSPANGDGFGPVQPAAFVQSGVHSVQLTPPPAEQTGVLVEVYSADPTRPPYAITDRTGRTVAYVTPAPGIEIRKHLGSEVRVQGESGYLQGLDTPHVLATAAERLIR